MRLIFAGTPEFAAQHLAALIQSGQQVVGVYTQPDRPAGRGQRLHESPVKTLAKHYQLPVFQPDNFKTAESRAELASLQADLMVVVAYGLLLPQTVLDTPSFGCINVHASLLPRWRGAAPIQRAIAAGDSESGVCVMQMEAGLDTGPVLLRRSLTLSPDETGSSLHDKLARMGAHSLIECLADLPQRQAQAEAQTAEHSCYAHKLSKHEAQIDWSQSALQIERQIRAFNPFPVAFTRYQGQPLKIWAAQLDDRTSDAPPGSLIEIEKQGLVVATADGCIRLTQVQPSGSRAMSIQDFLNGHPNLSLGTQLGL